MAKFFHLPAAPLRLNERHEWLHGDVPIDSRVARLFSRSIKVLQDGRYAVCLGRESEPVQVDDTAFWVQSMALEGPLAGGEMMHVAGVRLGLSDGSSEWLDPSTLMQSADNALYCRIIRQNFAVPCRFAPQQYHTLVLHGRLHQGRFEICIGQSVYNIGSCSKKPLPEPHFRPAGAPIQKYS